MATADSNGRRLDARLRERVRARWRGAHGARITLVRRIAAGVLLLLAVGLALRPQQGSATDEIEVLTAAHDLPPGVSLTADDVAVRTVPAAMVPDGALSDLRAVEGRILAGAARNGEILTDVRLTGPALTRMATGSREDAAVPIRLPGPGVAGLIHSGRHVDVIAVTRSGKPEILARKAPVLAVHPTEEGGDEGRLIIVGLPEDEAAAVASASLTRAVTVTLR